VNINAGFAQASSLGNIDKNESYDVYYGNGLRSESLVVRRVKIIRIDKINNLEFLVFINDSGFNARGKEGYIFFNSISAIVPSSTFTINGNENSSHL
jgi:hypothetical protein